jgi:hypothetical protein
VVSRTRLMTGQYRWLSPFGCSRLSSASSYSRSRQRRMVFSSHDSSFSMRSALTVLQPLSLSETRLSMTRTPT